MLAQGAIAKIAALIAGQVCDNVPSDGTLIIYDQTAFAALQGFQSFEANMQAVADAYRQIVPDTFKASLKTPEATVSLTLSGDPF